jgi:hypothetical protein
MAACDQPRADPAGAEVGEALRDRQRRADAGR